MKDQENELKSETQPLDFQVIDKRQFVDLDTIDKATPAEEKPRYPSYVEELIGRMAETERRFQEKKKQIDEEIARTKTRLEADSSRRLDLERQKIVLSFLEILDNLDRALDAAPQATTVEHLIEGIHMTAGLFRSKLQAMGVEPIEALDRPFDPNTEQAVGAIQVSDASRDQTVVEVVRPGYLIEGRLLRPAQVRVGRFE
jgi:molecular chaperone GrpE